MTNTENGHYTLIKKSDIEKAIISNSNFIIHASVGNTEKMYYGFARYHRNDDPSNEEWTQQIFFIFLNFGSSLTKEFFWTKRAFR